MKPSVISLRSLAALLTALTFFLLPACGSSSSGGSSDPGRVITGQVSLPASISAALAGSPVTLSTLAQTGPEQIATTTLDGNGNFSFPPIEGRDDETLIPVASIIDALTGLPASIGGLIPPPDSNTSSSARTTQAKRLDGQTQIACVAGVLLVSRDGNSPESVDNFTVGNLESGAARFVASTDFTDGAAVADSADATLVITDDGSMAPAVTGVSITLTWDGDPDLDLRVTDPSGEEIFFGNPTSMSGGSLDVDDTDGFGPENTSWPAGSEPSGDYLVELDYFSGSGSSAYTITVEVGDSVETFSGVIGEGERLTITTFAV